MYILLIICVCAQISLSLYVKFQFVSCGRLHPLTRREKPLPGHNEISLARQGADWDIFRDGSNRIQNQHTN